MKMQINPKISIITVVFNGEKFLEETIQSVISQTYDNIEYIIIDGGSTDGTIDIIKKYEDKLSYWISEPDGGIYNAMNKALKISTGDGILFLNAGDYFVGSVITKSITVPCFLPVKYVNYFGKLIKIKIKSHYFGLPTSHQGIDFENKEIKYNLSYEVASDYDYFLNFKYTNKLKYINSKGYVYYDNNGFSKKNLIKRDRELSLIIYKNFGIFYILIFKLKNMTKFIARNILKK